MNHQYSKFKNKAIPYAKVGRRYLEAYSMLKPSVLNRGLM